jgi:flagellar hook-length control protein FliK
MELLATLPTDLAVFVDPLARAAAPQQRELAATDAAAGAADGFAAVLELLAVSPGGGQNLPAAGKPLPLALSEDEPVAADFEKVDPVEGAPLLAVPLEAAATAHGLAAWLVQRAESAPATSAGHASPNPALQQGNVTRPPLVPTHAAGLPASIAMFEGAAGAAAATDASAATSAATIDTANDVFAANAPLPPEPPATQWRDDASLEPMPVGANRTRTESTSTSLQAPLAISAQVASMPTTSEAAALALARADGASAAIRGTRRLDALVGPSPPIVAAETPAMASFDWLPPGAAASASTSPPSAAPPPALPQAPVDARAPDWQAAFASRVQVLVDNQVGEARIKLNPPELGAVDVKISFVEDKTYVQLTAATAAGREELAQGLSRLRELFTASGLELGGASVHGGRGGHAGNSGHGQTAENTSRYAPDLPELASPLPGTRPRHSDANGAIDVFA